MFALTQAVAAAKEELAVRRETLAQMDALQSFAAQLADNSPLRQHITDINDLGAQPARPAPPSDLPPVVSLFFVLLCVAVGQMLGQQSGERSSRKQKAPAKLPSLSTSQELPDAKRQHVGGAALLPG